MRPRSREDPRLDRTVWRTLVVAMPAVRVLSLLMPVLLCALLMAGCDWYRQDEIALRALPYPYEAGVAVDDGSEPACLRSRGIRFVYDGEEVHTAGQDAACSLVDRVRQLWESLSFLYSRREWRGGSFFANRLFEPHGTVDGGTVYAYKAYGGLIAHLPSQMRQDDAAQVTEAITYELAAKGGVMIVGGAKDRQGIFGAVRAHLGRGAVHLVERDRLLAYGFVRRYLEWDATSADDGVTVHVRAVNDGVTEPWVPTVEELDGITFYTPDPGRTRVVVAGQELSDVSVNPPDRTRRGSVTIHVPPIQPATITIPGTSP